MKIIALPMFHLNLILCLNMLPTSSYLLNSQITFRGVHRLTNQNTLLLSSSTEMDKTSKDVLQESSNSKLSIKQKNSAKKDDQTPMFWTLEGDRLIVNSRRNSDPLIDNEDAFVEDLNSLTVNTIQFTVRGKARPLQRHRSNRGFTYNPSAKAQSSFSSVVQSMIDSFNNDSSPFINDNDINDDITPFFQSEVFLKMKLRFRMPRPKYHFKGKSTVLKPNSPKKYAPQIMSKGDIDNLAKFVLDSLNGIVYVDDKQIVSLSCTKIYDFEGSCNGAIDVFLERVHDDDDDWFDDSKYFLI